MLREWKLNLKVSLKRGARTAMYVQIAQALIGEIRRGRLGPGSVLPGSRELAAELGVNRKTILNVYDELVAQGWLISLGTRGTFVSSKLPQMPPETTERRTASATPSPGPQFKRLTEIGEVDSSIPRPGWCALDDGTPDTRLFPSDLFARAYRSATLLAAKTGQLTYGDPRGALSLRRAVSKMLNVERGLTTALDNICLTRGSQMAIYLTARAMIRPGDAVAVEDLTYPPAREAFRSVGAAIVRIRRDRDGLDPDDLERACRRQRIRLVYLTPHHHFPTTLLMRPDRRLRVLALAEQFGFAIVEDDYDHEFHFQCQPLLPLASVDPSKVVYVGSMSKLMSPHLRIGYLAGPEPLIERVAREIMIIDRQGDHVAETAAAELIEAGELRRHARKALGIYGRRREDLAASLRTQLGDAVDFEMPDGGLAFWLTFREASDLDRLEARAPSLSLLLPSSYSFSGDPSGSRGIRMGFARSNDVELQDIIQRFRVALAR